MSLPYLGLGLSSNAQRADSPHPYRLLEAVPKAFDFIEYSAPLDVAEAKAEATLFAQMLAQRDRVPLLYHPVHLNLWGPTLETPERLALLAQHVAEVNSPWVSNDVGWWHCGGVALPGYLYLTPPLDAQAVENAAVHARVVCAAAGVPVLLENPVVMTARGELHVLDFMERLSTATGCGILLDIGHLLSHQLARGLSLTQGLERFPFERVVEVHIAGGVITRRGTRQFYIDDHPQPVRDEVWSLLEWVLPKCSRLRALTYEGDGHPDAVAQLNLHRLRGLLSNLTKDPPLPPLVANETPKNEGARHLESEESARTWAVFDAVHSGRSERDLDGAVSELDFRLAVLAQTIDAAVPLTRLAVAPSREALARFARSSEFRAWFEHGARDVTDAFTGWAMQAARDPSLAGAEALVALEQWARHTARRLPNAQTMNAEFPLCLSEALHAAKALTRHLTARAAWSGTGFEATGLEGVLQAARRPSPGPWKLVLFRSGSRIDIIEGAAHESLVRPGSIQ